MTDRDHPITHRDLDARLRRLERRSRLMGAGWTATAALLGVALLAGQGEDSEHPWLTVKGLTVVDDEGRPRAHLGGTLPDLANPEAQSDASGLVLIDENGLEAASLTMKSSGARMLTVADPQTDRLALVVWPGGESGVYVLGPEDRSGYRHQIAVDDDGKTYTIMRSSDGEYIERIGEPGGSGGAGGGGGAQAARPGVPQGAGGWGGAGAGAGGGFPAGAGVGAGGRGAPGVGAGGFPGAGAGAGGYPGAGGGAGAPGANMQDLDEMRRQMIERMNLPPEEKERLLERMREAQQRRDEATEASEPQQGDGEQDSASEEDGDQSQDDDESTQDEDASDSDDDEGESSDEDGAEDDSSEEESDG